MNSDTAFDALMNHLDDFWRNHRMEAKSFPRGGGYVEIFPQEGSGGLEPQVYVTVGAFGQGMSGVEFVLLAPQPSLQLGEVMEKVVKAHRQHPRREGGIFELGRGWFPGSPCTHLLVMKPYPYGPRLEQVVSDLVDLRVLWLVPITPEEVDYVKREGAEALERVMESEHMDFLNIHRVSLV